MKLVDAFKDKHYSQLHIALGAFDGVHKAHELLIRQAISGARTHAGQSLILSFEPLPKEYFQTQSYQGRLTPPAIKKNILQNMGADHIFIERFEQIRDCSAEDFIQSLLEVADFLHFYAGADFRIGSKETPSYQHERVQVHQIDDYIIQGRICRSTEIRILIKQGLMQEAASLLGREYEYYSHTIKGDQIGRNINFPTLNLEVNDQVIPQSGVYFGEVSFKKNSYPAAIYVGVRPTLQGDLVRIEAHVLSKFPDKETPSNSPIAVRFIKKIFEEKRFESLEKLQEMLYNYIKVSSALAAERYKNKPAPPFIGDV